MRERERAYIFRRFRRESERGRESAKPYFEQKVSETGPGSGLGLGLGLRVKREKEKEKSTTVGVEPTTF